MSYILTDSTILSIGKEREINILLTFSSFIEIETVINGYISNS